MAVTDPRPPNSEETKRKKSKSALKRWNEMAPSEEIRFRKRRSTGMRLYWKKFTKEERKKIGMKGAIGRLRTKLRKLGLDEAEIEERVKEKYNDWLE